MDLARIVFYKDSLEDKACVISVGFEDFETWYLGSLIVRCRTKRNYYGRFLFSVSYDKLGVPHK